MSNRPPQETATAASSSATRGRSVASSDERLFLFSARGQAFAIPIVEVGRLLTETRLFPLPCAHPALAGIARDGSDLIPVYDLAGLLSDQVVPAQNPGTNIAVFDTARGPLGLRMEALRGTTTTAVPLKDPADVASRIASLPPAGQTIVTAVGEVAGEIFFFFSPEAFLVQLDLAISA